MGMSSEIEIARLLAALESRPAAPTSVALTDQEVIELTHYRRAAEQLRTLKQMGIPATRLHDNTVKVLRMHLVHPASTTPMAPKPIGKSARK